MKKTNLKMLLSGLTSVCMLASALPVNSFVSVAADTSEKILGDVNLSNSVEIADAVLILQSISDPANFNINDVAKDLADVNMRGNGVDAEDALAIQKYMAEIIDKLPESYSPGYDETVSSVNYIHLKSTSIETEGENMVVDGTTVTITASGEYHIDGTLDDGQIIVNVPDETVDPETVKLFLNGANITGLSAPAIYVENAENTSINLVEGTINNLSDGTVAYEGDYLGTAVVEAKDDITFKGAGTLNITANNQHGVQCNNDIKFTDGNVSIETLVEDAVRGKKSVTIKGTATINIDSESDGIKSSKGDVAIEAGVVIVKAGNDAVQAETTIDISGGIVTVGGDRGFTGVGGVNITGGNVVATATDNQTDMALLTASQPVLLMNCIDCPDATDGCWKKANTFGLPNTSSDSEIIALSDFVKKYKYVLLSNGQTSPNEFTFVNKATGTNITHSSGGSDVFVAADTITVFDNVDPAGK